MRVKDYVEHHKVRAWNGNEECEITGIFVDTRRKKQWDNVFVAIKGANVDGHSYIDQALSLGATILFVEDVTIYSQYVEKENLTIVLVQDTKESFHVLANGIYDNPANKLKLIGVTGTNGKTSVTTMLNHILNKMGHKTALIGTIKDLVDGEETGILKTTITTPDSLELAQIMKLAYEKKVEYVIMEVSSMALKTMRVCSYSFEVGAFLNLSQEHLDNHKTMEDYFESKCKLFEQSKKRLTNIDDIWGRMVKEKFEDVLSFSLQENADIYAKNIEFSTDSVQFDVVAKNAATRLTVAPPSNFGISNALAVLGIIQLLNLDMKSALMFVQDPITIDGRFNLIKLKNGATVCVDFAHTPNALDNLLQAIRKNSAYARMIAVFGCGGDRDKTKRMVMGQIAEKYSDHVIVTSDNPRSEKPEAICDAIFSGIKNQERAEIIVDRKKAIIRALEMSQKNDIVVIAGKGHESYQEIAGIRYPFNDTEEVKNWNKD